MNDFNRTNKSVLPEGKRKHYQRLVAQLTPPRSAMDRAMLKVYHQLLGESSGVSMA